MSIDVDHFPSDDDAEFVEFPEVQALPSPATPTERLAVAGYQLRQVGRVAAVAAYRAVDVAFRRIPIYVVGGIIVGAPVEIVTFETQPSNDVLQKVVGAVAFAAGAIATHAVLKITGTTDDWRTDADDVSDYFESCGHDDKASTAVAILDRGLIGLCRQLTRTIWLSRVIYRVASKLNGDVARQFHARGYGYCY